jgi:hypothetical protein
MAKVWKSLRNCTCGLISCPFCDNDDDNLDTYTSADVENGQYFCGDAIRCNQCQNIGILDYCQNDEACEPKWLKDWSGRKSYKPIYS